MTLMIMATVKQISI